MFSSERSTRAAGRGLCPAIAGESSQSVAANSNEVANRRAPAAESNGACNADPLGSAGNAKRSGTAGNASLRQVFQPAATAVQVRLAPQQRAKSVRENVALLKLAPHHGLMAIGMLPNLLGLSDELGRRPT